MVLETIALPTELYPYFSCRLITQGLENIVFRYINFKAAKTKKGFAAEKSRYNEPPFRHG
jgi:hypothetical protein